MRIFAVIRRRCRLELAECPYYTLTGILLVKVADHDHCSLRERVPFGVEGLEHFRCDFLYILFCSKRYSLSEKSAADLQAVEFISYIVASEFLDDYTFLTLDLILVKRNIDQPVLQNQEGIVYIL